MNQTIGHFGFSKFMRRYELNDEQWEKIFEKYLAFLWEAGFYAPNVVAHSYLEKVKPQYDFIVIDEVQDNNNIRLLLLLKSLHRPMNFNGRVMPT